MSGIDISIVANGTVWPVHRGKSVTGREPGITLVEDGVAGLMDAPIETNWIEDTERGSVWAGERFLARDLTLGFCVSDELAGSSIAGQLESEFRMAFSSRPDRWDPDWQPTKVLVDSDLSDERWLYVQMHEVPAMKMPRDPFGQKIYDIAYEVRAGQPLYESEKVVEVFEGSGTSGSGTITVSNPTDVEMRHTWVLTRATWTIPDPSWTGARGAREPGGDQADRTIPLPPITEEDQGVRITRGRRQLHAMTFNKTNFLGRMNGNWVRFDIPPYTPPTELPISYIDAPSGGARAELHQPRFWTRPVGLELP